jgi:hypothetical protein
MEKHELSIDELTEVARGMTIKLGPTKPTLPTGTGPTFPIDPLIPIHIHV